MVGTASLNTTVTIMGLMGAAHRVRIHWTRVYWEEWEGVRFHPATQNSTWLKTYAFFISGNFHMIFQTAVGLG